MSNERQRAVAQDLNARFPKIKADIGEQEWPEYRDRPGVRGKVSAILCAPGEVAEWLKAAPC